MTAALLFLALCASAAEREPSREKPVRERSEPAPEKALEAGDLPFVSLRSAVDKECAWVVFKRLPDPKGVKEPEPRFKALCVKKCPATHRPVPAAWPRPGGGVCVEHQVDRFFVKTADIFNPWAPRSMCPAGTHPQRADWPKRYDYYCDDDRGGSEQ